MSSNQIDSPCSETFKEVKDTIDKMVINFHKLYQLDYDELISAAYFGFIQAYQSYDLASGMKFRNWVILKVRGRLKDCLRKHILEKTRIPTVSLDDEFDEGRIKQRDDFDVAIWMENLTSHAKRVVSIALNQPIDVKLLYYQIGPDLVQDNLLNLRQAIREFFRERKWSERRINRAFLDVKQNL